MSYRSRKLIAVAVLVLGLPVYILIAAMLVSSFDRPHVLVEIGIYVGLGMLWALPLRRLFLGLGRSDPDARTEKERDRPPRP